MITTLVVASLAIWQVIKIWGYSELFAVRRAYAQSSNGFFGKLLQCSFCLSNWVSALLVCSLAASEVLQTLEQHVDSLWLSISSILTAIPAQVFAAARVANLCNDVFKTWDRTPKYATKIEILTNEHAYERQDESPRDEKPAGG